MSKRLFSFLIMFCFAGISVYTATAKIDPASVVAIWLCDEGAGKTVADASGNGHDGTFANKEGWTKDGKSGNALEFSGEPGNYVEIPPDASLTLEEWTITAWAKQTPPGDWSIVLVKDPANGVQNYALDMNEGGLAFAEVTSGGSWSDCGSTTNVQDDQWHFLAASYDGKNLHIYVDGTQENEQPFGPGDVNDAPVTIGGRLDDSQPIKGTIDEVGLFNVALSEADLTALMEDGLNPLLSVDPASKLATTWGRMKTFSR